MKKPNSKDYKHLLVDEYLASDMSIDDFKSTLTHFAKLYHKEQLKKNYKKLNKI